MLAPRQEDRGTEGQMDGLTDVNVPATPHPVLLPSSAFCLSSERQKRPLKLRTAGCSLKPQSARQRGSFGVCRRSWSRRSRCRRQLDSREWAHCAGIVCVGQRETSRLVELCAAIRSQSANTPGRGGAETAAKQVLAGETAGGPGSDSREVGRGRSPWHVLVSLLFLWPFADCIENGQ